MFCVIRESKLALCVLLQRPYLYLLHYIIVHSHAHEQIHHWFFLEKKVPRTPVVLKMAIQLRQKKAYMILCVLQASCVKNNTLILQRN